MDQSREKPNPEKVAFLRSLPEEVKTTITGEEAEQFMFGDEIPESLYYKIKSYLQEIDE